MESLTGLRALVTGAGQRIGHGIAIALARVGCDVVVHYNSSREGAEKTAKEIEALGRSAKVISADLSSADGPKSAADLALQAFGSLDILVNNASVFPDGGKLVGEHDLLRETFESWERAMAVNARAPFFLIQALAPALRKSRNGNVINILDTSVSHPFTSRASHTVSKHALAAVNDLAARTLAPEVRVNALELGGILPPPGLSKEDIASQNWGGVASVENAILFILQNRFINGEVIGLRGSDRFRKRKD